MRSTRRHPIFCLALILPLGAACASPAPSASGRPDPATLAAIRPKLDSIEARIGFWSARQSASIDSLRARVDAMAPPPAPADTSAFAESEAIRSRAVAPGRIRGIVLDADTGKPIDGAQVFLPSIDIGILSDTTGHFELINLPGGRYELVTQKVQYGQVSLPVSTEPPEGTAARVILHRYEYVLPNDAVVSSVIGVTVRDAFTGRAPLTATALRVTNGEDRWWNLDTAERGAAALGLMVSVGRGPFEVEVAADGYAPWYRRNVGTGRYDVWLLPTEDNSWRLEPQR